MARAGKMKPPENFSKSLDRPCSRASPDPRAEGEAEPDAGGRGQAQVEALPRVRASRFCPETTP